MKCSADQTFTIVLTAAELLEIKLIMSDGHTLRQQMATQFEEEDPQTDRTRQLAKIHRDDAEKAMAWITKLPTPWTGN